MSTSLGGRAAAWQRRLGSGFDAKAIESLLALDPQETEGLMLRLLKAFEESLSTHARALEFAVQEGDVQACGRAAHAVRSASTSMGALDFAEACLALERQAHALAPHAMLQPVGDPARQSVMSAAAGVAQQAQRLRAQVQQAWRDGPCGA